MNTGSETNREKVHVVYNIYHQNQIQVNNFVAVGSNNWSKDQKRHGDTSPAPRNWQSSTGFAKERPKLQLPELVKGIKSQEMTEFSNSMLPSPRIPKSMSFVQWRGDKAKDRENIVAQKKKHAEIITEQEEGVLKTDEMTVLGDEYLAEMSGYLLLVVIAVAFAIGIFWMMFSKLLPLHSGASLLSFMHNDDYYCWLIPLLLPLTMVVLYANWVAMKFFRHN
jgi:hypothetical protein